MVRSCRKRSSRCRHLAASISMLHCCRGTGALRRFMPRSWKETVETGVTIMQMDEGLDTGDILFKVATPIGPDDTAGSLHDRLAQLAPDALLACLDLLGRGAVSREKQDGALATYAPKLTRKDGEIAWNKPAEEIERRIRAMTPWPGAYTFVTLGDTRALLKIHRARNLGRKQRAGWNRCVCGRWRHSCCGGKGRNCSEGYPDRRR